MAASKDPYTKYTLLDEDPAIIKLRPWQMSTNIVLTVVLIIVLAVFEKSIKPFQRGFFCNDHSIMKPYVKNQTVSILLLGVVAASLVLLVVASVELLNKNTGKEKTFKEQETGHIYVGSVKIAPWVYRILSHLGFIIIGLTMSTVFTNIGKKLVGRLRPHFLSACLPNYKMFNCSDGYITADVCTGVDKGALQQARLSFPSGHASMAAFTSIFLALYIEYKIQLKHFLLAKPFTQFVLISLGASCSFTRISDYWHYWSDVLAGFLIGTLFAVYTTFGMMNLHNCEYRNPKRSFINPSVDIESQGTSSYNNEVE